MWISFLLTSPNMFFLIHETKRHSNVLIYESISCIGLAQIDSISQWLWCISGRQIIQYPKIKLESIDDNEIALEHHLESRQKAAKFSQQHVFFSKTFYKCQPQPINSAFSIFKNEKIKKIVSHSLEATNQREHSTLIAT